MESSAPHFVPPSRPEFLQNRRPHVPLHRRPALPKPAAEAAPSPAPIVEAPAKTGFGISSGIAQGLPIVLGYFPVSFALGILAAQLKFPFVAIALSSLIVFAGSAQFAALSLLAASAPGWTVVLTVFIVNFRHFLMSLAIAPHLKAWTRAKRVLFGLQLTDETFALHAHQFQSSDPGPEHVFTINVLAHAAWLLGTIAGYLVSWLLPDTKAFGFDMAMPCMFIALIVLQAKNRLLVTSGASAAVFALLLKAAGASHAAVLIGAVIGATIGAGIERKQQEAADGKQ